MASKLESALHKTIKGKSKSSTVRQLINEGADCNLSHFDLNTLTFISPIWLTTQDDRRYRALRILYEHRNNPRKTHLNKQVTFYTFHYDPKHEEKNEILLEYTVSRLLHLDILKRPIKDFHTLLTGVHDIDKARLRGRKLCTGSTQDTFLQVRIFTLFRRIVKIHIDFPIIIDDEKLTVIENELLQNLETYYFLYDVDNIPVPMTDELLVESFVEVNLSEQLLIDFYRCIAKSVISKIRQLQPDQEYTIPTGWRKHAVCVSFRRISSTHIHIRVDNPSASNPVNAHAVDYSVDDYHLLKPRILGRLHVDDLKNNMNYFISLIDSVKRDLKSKEGISLIYDLREQIRNLDRKYSENIPSFPEQAAANCFLRCFDPGFQMRLGKTREKLYQELISFEKDTVNLLIRRCEENHRHDLNGTSNRFLPLARKDDTHNLPFPERTRIQEQLKMSYQQRYRHLSSVMDTYTCNPCTEKYVPLQFEKNKDKTSIDLKNLLIEPRVLIIGDAGCGKTTVCQYVTFSWACGRMWQSEFEWLFYIKMRNLNSKIYPSQPSTSYSLIDIIEKECFQGFELAPLDKHKLKYQLTQPSKILWILDGCDERTAIPDHLHSIEKDLLAKQHVLLTSRPYEIHHFQYDVSVRIKGFTYRDIETYIMKYFSTMFRTTATECWSFISCSEQLRQTACIPACLEIICTLWESGKERLESDIRMGQLYQKMCEYLLRRYLLKFHGQSASSLAGRDIYQQPNARSFIDLEHLAFEATRSNRFSVSGDEITDIAGVRFVSVLQIGFLKSKTRNPSPIPSENIYDFIHRSFQEYLCARYIIGALSSSSSSCSEEQQRKVIQFITNEKYHRPVRETFRLFFELKRSSLCTDRFWSAVDSKPRDLIGLRHISRIRQWFPHGTCAFSFEDEQKIDKRTIDAVTSWLLNKDRRAHDYGNKYLFDWFIDVISHHLLTAWKEDLFIVDSSKRRYFLPDLWSAENIDALQKVYDDISENMHALRSLIMKGPTSANLNRFRLDPNLFILPIIDDQTETSDFLIAMQKKAQRRESITTLTEFQALLQNYVSYAKLNRRAMALDTEIWGLEIDPSALANITRETLELLSLLLQEKALFFRDLTLPVIPFLALYAKPNNLNGDILCRIIVSITMSSDCFLTALSEKEKKKKLSRIYHKDTFEDIEFLNEEQWLYLINAFEDARIAYGYSDFFD